MRIQNKNTYWIGSYHQPHVAHQAGVVSQTGADVLGFKDMHVERERWVAKEEVQGCYTLTNKASQGTRFVLVDTGNTVTVEPFENGKYSQQWVAETIPEETAWGHIINRQTGNYLQFNGHGNKLTCIPLKPKNNYQYWCFGLVAKGTDGDWLDSFEPKVATTAANTNSVTTTNSVTNGGNTSTAHQTSVVQYNNPTKTLVAGGDAHENSYAEVLQLKMQLYEAQLRLQQEQLAEKDRQLAARGLTANSYGTGGLGGNANGLGNVYGNGLGGSVNDLTTIYGNGTGGRGGNVNGLGNIYGNGKGGLGGSVNDLTNAFGNGMGGLGGNVNGLGNVYGNGIGGQVGNINGLGKIYGNGIGGQVGNVNGLGNVYGNGLGGNGYVPGNTYGTGGFVGNLNGIGNGVAGLSDADIRNAALHGKLNILQIEIRHKQNQIFDAAKAPGDHTHVDTALLSKEKELAEQAHNHVANQLKAQIPVK